jgi:signal transduction histidine kinase
LQVDFHNIDYVEPVMQEKEIVLYRIAQELCANAVKHARAKHLLIQLSRHNGTATLVIEDDGIGFDTGQLSGDGIGLNSVRSRVQYLRGELELMSKPGEGTSVTIQIPVS